MSRAKHVPLTAQAARAIDRVLGAEREADISLAQTRQQAEQMLDRAREDALLQVNRATDRMAAWQRTHAQAMQGRQTLLRERAATQGMGSRWLDKAALAAAVQAVAVRLCGGATSDMGDIGAMGAEGPAAMPAAMPVAMPAGSERATASDGTTAVAPVTGPAVGLQHG